MKRRMHDCLRLSIALAIALIMSFAQAQGRRGFGGRGQNGAAGDGDGKTVVLNVGDSITQGVGQAGNYSTPLGEDLGSSYTVVGAGISGATYTRTNRRDYRTSRQYPLAIASAPNIVTIMLGTNDAKISASDPNQDVWPEAKESYKRDVEDLIRRFEYLPTAPRVFVCIPIPASNDNRYNSKGDTIRDNIVPVLLEAATEEETGIIDLWHTEMLGQTGDGSAKGPLGTEPSKLYQDGVHPNKEGNQIIAAKLAQIIKMPEPVVVADERKLSSSAEGVEYQWFRNGVPVAEAAGGRQRAIEAAQPGMYAVAVMLSKDTADRLISREVLVK